MLQSAMKRVALYTTGNQKRLLKAGLDWNFHGENTREHLHSLHPYPAKFIPQIPRKAILTWSRPGDLVYDPFCGCGTTLLEARLLGRPSIGTDNNAVAVLVTRAKIAKYSAASIRRVEAFAENLNHALHAAPPHNELVPLNGVVDYWFSKEVSQRLSVLKALILKTAEPERTLLLAAFSAIIVRVSLQDSDTRYARVPREVSRTDVDRIFKAKLRDVVESLPSIIGKKLATARVALADSRAVPFIRSGSVSLIVTSPPYLNAYDYHKYHRQRLHWIDGDVAFARDLEIGGHDEFTKPRATPDQYFTDMEDCFAEWQRVLKRRGRCVVLIGDAIVTKQPVAVADRYIQLAEKRGLRLEDRWIRELQATKRAFNVKNSRISHEHVLLFRKP